jgi:hypothetical protein
MLIVKQSFAKKFTLDIENDFYCFALYGGEVGVGLGVGIGGKTSKVPITL